MSLAIYVTEQNISEGFGRDFPAHEQRQLYRKLEAVVSSTEFEVILPKLQSLPVDIVVTEVHTCGSMSVLKRFYRGAEFQSFPCKLKLEMVVPAQEVSDVAAAFAAVIGADRFRVVLSTSAAVPLTSL